LWIVGGLSQAFDGGSGWDHTAGVEDVLRCGCYRREIIGGMTLEQDSQVGRTQCIAQVWHWADRVAVGVPCRDMWIVELHGGTELFQSFRWRRRSACSR